MDVLLIVSFGGPEGPEDVVPFLENVTAGRGIPRERLIEVGAHYEHFQGVSPINAQNRQLVASVRQELERRGDHTPVLLGNRNWDPFLGETFRTARELGATRIVAFVTSAYSSYSGCRQYRENLYDALAEVQRESPSWRPEVLKLPAFFHHPGFVQPFVESTRAALAQVPAGSRLVFTTHSIPTADAQRCEYEAQHREVASAVAESLGHPEWDLVFQSRSGAPHVPWLEPDVGDHLHALKEAAVPGVVLIPIGFVSDHIEVKWDLDTVALGVAHNLGLPAVRAATPWTHPAFVSLIADLLGSIRAVADHDSDTERDSPTNRRSCSDECCPNPRGPRPALGDPEPRRR